MVMVKKMRMKRKRKVVRKMRDGHDNGSSGAEDGYTPCVEAMPMTPMVFPSHPFPFLLLLNLVDSFSWEFSNFLG